MVSKWFLIAVAALASATMSPSPGHPAGVDAAMPVPPAAGAHQPAWLARCHPAAKFPVGTTLQVVQVQRPTRGSTIDVRVRSDKSPVVLLLASAKPAIWRLDVDPSAAIRGILIAGRVAQIQGVDARVPTSRCDPPQNRILSGPLVDQVADFLALPVDAVQRGSVDEGFDITSRPYPNLDVDNRYDRCRVDFDYGGSNITRGSDASPGGCRALCDTYGPLNADQGRVICVVNGRPAWAYPAKPGYLARSCRFVASDGRNIRSYATTSAYQCLDMVCFTGSLYTSSNSRDRWESNCVFKGKTIKRFRLKPWPWLQEPIDAPG